LAAIESAVSGAAQAGACAPRTSAPDNDNAATVFDMRMTILLSLTPFCAAGRNDGLLPAAQKTTNSKLELAANRSYVSRYQQPA
jgi:hypothetical protein